MNVFWPSKQKKGGISPFFTIIFESHIRGGLPPDEHQQRESIQDFGRRPLYEYVPLPDKRRYFPLFVATCSGKQPYRIGREGEGGRKEGQGSAGDILGRWWRSLVHLALSSPPLPAWRGLSLLVLGLTGPQGLSLAAIPATLLLPNYNPSFLTHDQNSKCHENLRKHPRPDGRWALEEF